MEWQQGSWNSAVERRGVMIDWGSHSVIFKQLQIHPLVSPCSGILVFKRTLPGTRVSKSQNMCVCNCGILAFFNHKTLKLTNNKLIDIRIFS